MHVHDSVQSTLSKITETLVMFIQIFRPDYELNLGPDR